MPKRAKQQNVIIIVPHDLGDYLGCYGHAVVTPNIDRLAKDGIRFTNHFSTCPICSPARGSIITGRHPHNNGLMGLCNLGWDLPKHNITDAQRFAEAGYRTYLVGGQHEKIAAADLGFHFKYEVGGAEHNNANDIIADTVEELLQKIVASRRDSTRHGDSPFYMRLGGHDVHRGKSPVGSYYGWDWAHGRGVAESDVEVIPQWKDTDGLRYDLAAFTGSVGNFDRGVGKVLDALERHGLADDTIVILTTDHGIDFPSCKGTLYDLGLRTTLIARCPGQFKAGTTVNALTSHIDILPTMLDLCDIQCPKSVQGSSLVPLMEGKTDAIHEEIFGEESSFPRHLMRCVRNKRFKLIRNFSTGTRTKAVCSNSRTVEGTGEFYIWDFPEYELYDLTEDPHEMKNVSGVESYKEVETQLRRRLDRWLRETKDPVLDNSIKRPDNEYQLFPKHHLEHSNLLFEHK